MGTLAGLKAHARSEAKELLTRMRAAPVSTAIDTSQVGMFVPNVMRT